MDDFCKTNRTRWNDLAGANVEYSRPFLNFTVDTLNILFLFLFLLLPQRLNAEFGLCGVRAAGPGGQIVLIRPLVVRRAGLLPSHRFTLLKQLLDLLQPLTRLPKQKRHMHALNLRNERGYQFKIFRRVDLEFGP